MSKIWALVCFLVTTSIYGQSYRSELIATEYFANFDYKNEDKINSILEFEKKLIEHVTPIADLLDKNPQYQPQNKKDSTRIKLAMNLVYAGMMILNNNNGAIEGKIPFSSLISKIQLAKEKSLKAELIARYELCARFLEIAKNAAPKDDRIPSWYSAAILRLQKFRDGKVEDEIMDYIVANAVKAPIFHLFNALTMTSDYDFGRKREDELFKMVELMNSKDSPCLPVFFRKGEAKKCNTTNKTPFAFQGVTAYMGDAYLKQSIKLASDDSEKATHYLNQARSLYKRINWPLFILKTRKWDMKPLINERLKVVEKIQNDQDVSDFFQSSKYLDMYTCVSCHQNGKDKSALKVQF
jgi:hypothetical protein